MTSVTCLLDSMQADEQATPQANHPWLSGPDTYGLTTMQGLTSSSISTLLACVLHEYNMALHAACLFIV